LELNYSDIRLSEDLFEKSLSPYALTKTAGVHFAYMIGKNENFPIISIRPGVLYGKYQEISKFIPYVVKHLKENKPLNLTLCEQKRDVIRVDRLIVILLKLVISGKCKYGEIYNIASGKTITLKEIVKLAKERLNSSSIINFGAFEYRKNEIIEFDISIEKVQKILNDKLNLNTIDDFYKYLENINLR
jgi:nucleoside-diphosphate-sugar epimerase